MTSWPRRRPWALRLARWYARRRVRRAFDGVMVSGLEEARARARREPLVVAMNHVSWWDPFVVVLLDEALGTESYCLMDAANLSRLPFFGAIGAVPLRRHDARQALADLKAHAALLGAAGRAVWIFPQGEQRPSHLRPLGLHRGVGVLAHAAGARVLPVSLTYAFGERAEPSIVVALGEVCDVPRRGAPVALEEALVRGLDRNDEHLSGRVTDHKAWLAPRTTDAVPWAGRLLASLRLGGANRG